MSRATMLMSFALTASKVKDHCEHGSSVTPMRACLDNGQMLTVSPISDVDDLRILEAIAIERVKKTFKVYRQVYNITKRRNKK